MDIGQEECSTSPLPSLMTRTTNDITQIQMIVAMGLQMMIKAPIMAVWGVIKILGKSWELSVVTAGFVVAICLTVFLVMATCIPRFRIVQKLTDSINRVARENLTGINVVHAFNAEKYQNDKFDGPSKDMMNVQMKNQKLFALVQPTMTLSMNGLALVIYWLGAALVNQIPLTDPMSRLTMFSNVLVFSTYATYIIMSFMMLVMIFMMLPQAEVSAERINEVLDRKASITEGSVRERQRARLRGVPGRLLPLPRRLRGRPEPHQFSSQAGRNAGHHRCDRQRQIHAGQPDPPVLRRDLRAGAGGRRGREGLCLRRAV